MKSILVDELTSPSNRWPCLVEEVDIDSDVEMVGRLERHPLSALSVDHPGLRQPADESGGAVGIEIVVESSRRGAIPGFT